MYSIDEIERMVNGEDRFVLSDGGSLDNSPHHTCKIIIRQLLAERSQIRRQAFEEAAEIADYGYDGYGKNLPSTRVICMTIADMIRCKAEQEIGNGGRVDSNDPNDISA